MQQVQLWQDNRSRACEEAWRRTKLNLKHLGWHLWLEAHESALARENAIKLLYIVAWWISQNWKYLGHEDWWSKDFIMDLSYSSIFTWDIYILESSLHSNRWYANYLCIYMAYLTRIMIDAFSLFQIHILAHTHFIFMLIYCLFVGWLIKLAMLRFVHKQCYHKYENDKIKVFEMDCMPNQSWEDIWLVRKRARII
jgi:hypothetical protein